MSVLTAQEAVAAGAAELDAKLPGWWREINVHELHMDCSEECILGQLYGHYDDGALELGFDRRSQEQSEALGFARWDYEYDDLEGAWIDLIQARREA
jgi:hypothetical protein